MIPIRTNTNIQTCKLKMMAFDDEIAVFICHDKLRITTNLMWLVIWTSQLFFECDDGIMNKDD